MKGRRRAIVAGLGAAVVTALWLSDADGPGLSDASLLAVLVTAGAVGAAITEGAAVFIRGKS